MAVDDSRTGRSRRLYLNFYSLHSVTGNLGDTGNDLSRFGNGNTAMLNSKITSQAACVVGYGIKMFGSSLFTTSPDHLEVCAGSKSGSKAAIHAMHSIFEADDANAMLLINASNVFNLLVMICHDM